VRGGDRRRQHRAHPDAARQGKFLDTQVRHFLLGPVARLSGRVISTTRVALLVAALSFAPTRALARAAAQLAAVHLPTVAATAHVEDRAAQIAPCFSKAVLRLVAMHDARHA
jgi:hypothetical protein